MSVSDPDQNSSAQARRLPAILKRRIASARRSLMIERLLAVFWPLWCLAALTGALLLLDVFGSAPRVAALTLAGVLALAALVFGFLGWRAYSGPTREDALRSLDLSVSHRAASMLDDKIAVGADDPAAARMWTAHRARLAREAEKARAPAADLRLSSRDTWGLRYSALLVLLVAAAWSRVGGADKVAALLDPAPAPLAVAALDPALEAWAAPPPYTGLAPVYLTQKSGEILLPVGTVVTLRASGVREAPVLEGVETGFSSEIPGVYGATLTLEKDTEIAVLAGTEDLGRWALTATPDTPPQIGVTEEPAPTATRGLGFAFAAEDDYGVAEARGVIMPDRSGMETPPEELDEPIALALTPPMAFADEVLEQSVEEDLTEHPLAGSPVTLTLFAQDGAGQQGESAPAAFTLPARIFTEPMAKALIEERRKLAWDIRDAWDVHDMLGALTDYPDDYFSPTTSSAYLIVSTAIRRMSYALDEDRMIDEREGVLDLLWRAALMLEEGDLSSALERLRTARRKLQDAIERGASDEEIQRLTQDMRQAMNEYLDEMTRQAMRDAQNGDDQAQQQQQQDQQNGMSREDLERMLDQLEKAAREGDKEAAEQMLSMLGQMLENMRMQRADRQNGGGQNEQDMQALQDMMREQQDLADQTFRDLQEGAQNQQQNRPGQGGSPGDQPQGQQQPGTGQQGMQGDGQGQGQGQQQAQGDGQGQGQGQHMEGEGQGGDLAGRQEGLRGELEGVLGRTQEGGEASERLGDAEREMGAARDSLGEGDLDAALDQQTRALDQLREGAQAMAREAERQASREGRGEDGQGRPAEGAMRPAERVDPLGRLSRTYGPDDGLGVEVPGERSRNKALEIQREIRKRQADRLRPDSERDYLDRLQRPF